MGFHYYFVVIIHVTLVRQLSSFSQNLFYIYIILNIQARLFRAPASQELSVGTLPLRKTTHLQGRISEIYILSSVPHRLPQKERAPAVFLMENKGYLGKSLFLFLYGQLNCCIAS